MPVKLCALKLGSLIYVRVTRNLHCSSIQDPQSAAGQEGTVGCCLVSRQHDSNAYILVSVHLEGTQTINTRTRS